MKFIKYLAGAILLASGFQAVGQTTDASKPNVMTVHTPFHQYQFGIKDVDKITFSYQEKVPTPENYDSYRNYFYDYPYRLLHGWFGRDFDESVMMQGDDMMAICYTTGNYYDDGRAINGSIHCHTLDNWSTYILSGILDACKTVSDFIAQYENREGFKQEIAKLRAIRAYYHFWGMELYGDVPIIDHVIGEKEVLTRTPRATVARFIANELEDLLSQEGDDGTSLLSKANDETTYGKPNYWMATALLAKVYLNWGVYTTPITQVSADTPNPMLNRCVELCDELINCGLFSVGYGYRHKFFPDNGVHISDFIYAYDIRRGSYSDGAKTWTRWSYYKLKNCLKPQILNDGAKMDYSTAGTWVLTPQAAAKFNLPGDERNLMILQGPVYMWDKYFNITDTPVNLYAGDECTDNLLIGQLEFVADFEMDDPSINSLGAENAPVPNRKNIANGTALLNSRKGARCFKFPSLPQDYYERYFNYNRQQENDYPIFRLADIVLMKAECLLRGATPTNGDTPASLMNIVRRCSGAPDVIGTPTIQDLMDERLRELIMEPWRRNDLIRNGMFEDDWAWKNGWYENGVWHERLSPCGTPARDKRHRLFPIHRSILEANPTWSQNPGYQGI